MLLIANMVELARQYGRYGCRRTAALVQDASWQVNDKRVERLWRREGLKVPAKQPKKERFWLSDSSCVHLRPSIAITSGVTTSCTAAPNDGKVFRTLTILDEFNCEYLAIRVKQKLNSTDVIDALSDLFILHGVPTFIS